MPRSSKSFKSCNGLTASKRNWRSSRRHDRRSNTHMSSFLVAETSPFLVATLVLLSIGVVEGLGLMIGSSPSQWLDHWLHLPEDGVVESVLGWLHVGRV